MPKVSKLQSSFNAGQISKSVLARVDNPRYDQALLLCQNYIPIVQGPLIRRPGTKYISYAKNQSAPFPALIPFQFSATQNYALEFGDHYIRFYTNEGQIITGSNVNNTQYSINGNVLYGSSNASIWSLWANRIGSNTDRPGESWYLATLINANSTLELYSPYAGADVAKIKWTQKQDTLYLSHPNYPPYKLVRLSATEWEILPVKFVDGPYLPLNSYQTPADSANIKLAARNVTGSSQFVTTGPMLFCSSVISGSLSETLGTRIRVITTQAHGLVSGAKVMLDGVAGTIEANNIGANGCPAAFGSSTIAACAAWTITVINSTAFDLLSSTFTNAYTGSGVVYPALFQMNATGSWADWNLSLNYVRSLGIVNSNAIRYSYHLTNVINAACTYLTLDSGQDGNFPAGSGYCSFWYLGCFNGINGFPSCVTFHQDRLTFAGHPNIPQQIDMSMTGNYETFSASGSNLQVNNNNAVQFSLSSNDLNAVKWIKSTANGLLAGTASAEWSLANASTQNPAITPTNPPLVTQVTSYGSYDTDAIPVNNSILYIQRAGRKTRELLYYWQIGSFRSTNISELAESLSLPQVTKLASVREPNPQVWAMRGDGALLTAAYNRDDTNFALNVGWAPHILGGRSDSAGTQPVVQSMCSIPSGDATYDELWLVTKRYLNGTTLATIEYMSKPFDDSSLIEDSFHFDCGATYFNSSQINGISFANPSVFTMASSIANGQTVKVYGAVGPSFLNENSYVVGSVSGQTCLLMDLNTGLPISIASSSPYTGSSGSMAAKVSSVTGLKWLAGETVGVIADGAIHPNSSVTAAGVLNLAFPAAKVQIGYPYASLGQLLRSKDGSAQGTSIGSRRRVNRVAFMLHNVGDFNYGPTFTNMVPAEFYTPDQVAADMAPPLFDGIHRDGIESDYGFDDTICFAQSSGLPGMIQGVVRFFEEQDI